MTIELNEKNSEYVEGLLARLNKKYPGCKWTADEIVNGILFNYFGKWGQKVGGGGLKNWGKEQKEKPI